MRSTMKTAPCARQWCERMQVCKRLVIAHSRCRHACLCCVLEPRVEQGLNNNGAHRGHYRVRNSLACTWSCGRWNENACSRAAWCVASQPLGGGGCCYSIVSNDGGDCGGTRGLAWPAALLGWEWDMLRLLEASCSEAEQLKCVPLPCAENMSVESSSVMLEERVILSDPARAVFN